MLITDNGSEFKNALFKEVCKKLNLTQHHITAYLPSSNLVECHHSSLKKCIAKFCHRDAPHWYEIVQYACLAQNVFPHTLKGESAMFKMFAHDPIVLGMETMFEPKHRYLVDKDTFTDLEALHCTCKLQQGCKIHARKQNRTFQERRALFQKVGDAVLFRNHNKTGFSPNFPGCQVVQKIDDSNYVINTLFLAKLLKYISKN